MHRLQTTKLDTGQKTRDSLKQHTHKQKALAHQTVTRNYKLQHTGVLHLQLSRQSSTIIQNCNIQSIKFATKKGAPEP